jgi:hypothetical protein
MDNSPTALPFDTIVQFTRAAASFLSGALAVYGLIRVKKTDVFRRLAIRHLRRDLQAAQDRGDRDEVRRLELQIQIQKMYLSDAASQGTAISQIVARGGEDAFELLAERFTNPPPLRDEVKAIMRSGIKRLALSLTLEQRSEPPTSSGNRSQKARKTRR